jgi:Holliday junction resolvasome RuvABC endonuclease subunit
MDTTRGKMKIFNGGNTIMGLDPGIVNFGWAVLGLDCRCESGVILPEQNEDAFTRLAKVSKGIADLLEEFQPDVIVMEKMMIKIVHNNMLLVYAANMVAGMTARIFNYTNNYPIIEELNPNTTKKILGVKTKKDTKQLVKKCFGITERITEHEADSFGNIIAYVMETKERGNPVYEHIKECINANKCKQDEESDVIDFHDDIFDDDEFVRKTKQNGSNKRKSKASKARTKRVSKSKRS